jgi:hypothetical protein
VAITIQVVHIQLVVEVVQQEQGEMLLEITQEMAALVLRLASQECL